MLGMSVQGRWLLGIAVIGVSILSGDRALAQITPDRTLPNNSIVTPIVTQNGTTVNITGGTQAGANLFHSFQEFSVPMGGNALFNNAVNIQNIISRVTGGSMSNINGSIQTLGRANLFLINPNGIVFGQNASLNVGGSFVASTANAIQFGNQGTFSASVPNNPALLTVNPTALFYNQIVRSASIQNSSTAPAGVAPTGSSSSGLRVPDGKSLLLVGGDIQMDGGRLRAYGGRVELGGLAATGTVGLGVDGNNLSLSFPAESTRSDVSLLNGASVNVSAAGGGSITVNASNLNISGRSALIAGIGQGLESVGSQAGDITLNATGDIKLDGSGSGISNIVAQEAIGNGGKISISAESVSLTSGSNLDTSSSGLGNGGSITINARDTVSFDGSSFVSSNVDKQAVGDGGDIRVTTGSLSVTNGAELQANIGGKGNVGNVIINARGRVSFDGISRNGLVSGAFSRVIQNGVGKGGDIRISADSLSVTNGASLNTAISEKGDAGSIIIDAHGSVSFDQSSTVFSALNPNSLGKGGDIRISADSLSVTNGASLAAGTRGKGDAGDIIINTHSSTSFDKSSGVFSTVEQTGVGKGGDIRISADSLSVTNGSQLESLTRGKGDAGNVIIDVRGKVSFDGTSSDGKFPSGALSGVEKNSVGKGGDIRISAGSLSVNGGLLNTSTSGKGNAGDVIINTSSTSFDKSGGVFSTVEQTGVGKGGDIRISADSLSVTNGAELLSFTRGQGDAGNVIIDVRGKVSFDGTVSGAGSNVEQTGVGKGGDIRISADSLSVTNGAELQSLTSGQGDAGNVIIDARGSVSFDGTFSGALSTVDQTGVGKGGDIHISADSLSVTNGAELQSLTSGQGDAGNVIIDARGRVSFNGISSNGTFGTGAGSSVEQTGVGKGGDIHISADSLFVTNEALLVAATKGKGGAGNIIIDARGSVFFDNGFAFSTVEQTGVGKGGDIHISADSLSVTNGSQLAASTLGQGNAGNVIIDVRSRVFFDHSVAFGTVEQTGVGKGGDIRISADSLSVTNGAQLAVSAVGQGDAGNIEINAPDSVSVSGTSSSNGRSSGLLTSTFSSTGIGGNITIKTPLLRVSDGAVLDARTANNRNGGNITLNVKQGEFLNGGQLLSTSSGAGNAGKITVNATDQVIVDGSDRTFNQRVKQFGTDVVAPVDPSSGFFVRSQSTGSAGDINVTSPQIHLDNSAKFIAESALGNGGNINLQVRDLLLLDHGSLISTSAGTANAGGDGGNITINTPNGFIVAFPDESSNITANAYTGIGGRVQINATGVYGIQFRDQLNPLTNNITSSSEFGSAGTVQFNIPNNDLTQGLAALQSQLVNVDNLIANSCIVRTQQKRGGTFFITGAGGLPNRPGDVSVSSYPTGEVRSLPGRDKGDRVSTLRPWRKGDPIVEPQGVYQLPNGHLVLSRECNS